jgi:hypothetical protein
MTSEGFQITSAGSDSGAAEAQRLKENCKVEEVRLALQRWQKAAHEWSEIYRRFTQESGPKLFERKRQLRLLEKRLNDAADAYEQARRGADQYSMV